MEIVASKTCNVCLVAKTPDQYAPHMDRCRDCHNRMRREKRAKATINPDCIWCGKTFVRIHNSQKLCSATCKKAWDRQRAGLIPVIQPIPCDECGLIFQPPTTLSRHCSKQCHNRGRHRVRSADPKYLQSRKEYALRYKVEHADRMRDRNRKRRERDPDAYRKYQREWAASHQYDTPSWRSRNLDKAAAKQRIRNRRIAALTPYAISHAEVMAKVAYWGSKCWLCGGAFQAVDHVKPLAKDGLNILANLRPICTSCNSRKRDRWFGVQNLDQLLPT